MPERFHRFPLEHVPEYSFDQAHAQMASLLNKEVENIEDDAVDKFLGLVRQHRLESDAKAGQQRPVVPFREMEKFYAELAMGSGNNKEVN